MKTRKPDPDDVPKMSNRQRLINVASALSYVEVALEALRAASDQLGPECGSPLPYDHPAVTVTTTVKLECTRLERLLGEALKRCPT